MNQQQKREKAAELLGWKRLEHPITGNDIWTFPGKFARDSNRLPLYDEDLNLMAGAEKALTEDQRQQYASILGGITGNDNGRGWTPLSNDDCFPMLHATAAQRLDAWLEVMMEVKE